MDVSGLTPGIAPETRRRSLIVEERFPILRALRETVVASAPDDRLDRLRARLGTIVRTPSGAPAQERTPW